MDQMKIIVESLLTGSQFEVSINEHDKVLIVKSHIQKILGEIFASDYLIVANIMYQFFALIIMIAKQLLIFAHMS